MMRFQTQCRFLLLAAWLWASVATVPAFACSVPVFRYALEHWAADSYLAVVFHRGPLSDLQQSWIRQLGSDGKAGQLHANIAVRTVDLDQNANAEEMEFWRKLGADTLPYLVVRYPLAQQLPVNAWSGPLSADAIDLVLDSPARREIAQRLGSGQTAVWVLLEIGDQPKDDAAARLIEERLKYLTSVLELPKLEAEDVVNGLISIGQDDLKLQFSTLRVSRQDPAERAFVKTLLGTEADLEELAEPMVFPIYGRGRALYALIGKGINHETIDAAASFLIGRCSCQVKELNPGIDLLIAADWNAFVKPATKEMALMAAPAKVAGRTNGADTVIISGDDSDRPTGGASPPKRLMLRVAVGLVISGLITAGIVFARRGS